MVSYKKSCDFSVSDMIEQVEVVATKPDRLSLSKLIHKVEEDNCFLTATDTHVHSHAHTPHTHITNNTESAI